MNRLMMAAAALSLSCAAWADGTATLQTGGERMNIEYLGDMVRMNVGQGDNNYMVVRDGRVYSIMEGQVFDASSFMEAFASDAPAPGADIGKFHGLKSTGRSETVAGMTGEVFELDFTDHEGQRRQSELVLSSDPRARSLQKAFNGMSMTMAKAMGKDSSAEVREMERMLGDRGILRFDQDMQVVSISGGAPAASRFELPGEPQDMGGMGQAMSEMFGDRTDRQRDRASQRTEREVDQRMDRTVDRAMDRLFGR